MGAAMTPKGSPPASRPYIASVPWMERLTQGVPLASSIQLKYGISASPIAPSIALLCMKPVIADISVPIPADPRLSALSSLSALVSAELRLSLDPTRSASSISQEKADSVALGRSSSGIGAAFSPSAGASPEGSESTKLGALSYPSPGVRTCISISPPPPPSASTTALPATASSAGNATLSPMYESPLYTSCS